MDRRCFIGGMGSLVAVGPLGACANTPPPAVFPELTWGYLPPIKLRVDDVQVFNSYQAPGIAPFVDHAFPTPPARAAFRWASDRLQAGTSNSGNIARATVLDGRVEEIRLETQGGIVGALKKEQSERYDGILSMRVEIFTAAGGSETVEVTVQRSQTVSEGLSVTERRQIWFEYTEAMMVEFNTRMEEEIRRRMRGYLMV
ncbi:MAG: hypothetical protein AAF220_05160 [Pseudomonadota bacterium]